MAMTATTLAAAASASTLRFIVTAATGATVGGFIKVDDEFATITAIDGTVITVRGRGMLGGQAVAHGILSPTVFGLMTDLATPAPKREGIIRNDGRFAVTSIGADGAVAVPNQHTLVGIKKAGACAVTVADPGVDQDGIMLIFVSLYGAAHTITLTTGSGGSNATDVYTMSGAVGDSIVFISLAGVWRNLGYGLTAAEGLSAAVA